MNKDEYCCPACKEKYSANYKDKSIMETGPLADEERKELITIFYTKCPNCGFLKLIKYEHGHYDYIDNFGLIRGNAFQISQK